MRTYIAVFMSGVVALSIASCSGQPGAARSEPFQSEITGGQMEWVYWPGKKGSTALWLVPVESQDPVLTLTCTRGGWKMSVRGYLFQNYRQNGPVMFMDVEGGGARFHSRVSWAPTEDTPIARGDMRVTIEDLQKLAAARTITIQVADEKQVFNGFGKAGARFPAECTKALEAANT